MNDCDVKLDAFVAHIAAEIPDALEGLITQAARRVLRDFLGKTRAAKETFTEDSIACLDTYLIDLDKCWQINTVECVILNGCVVPAVNHKEMGCHGWYRRGDHIHIAMAPDHGCPDGFTAEITKVPSVGDCAAIDEYIDPFFDAIYDGTMAAMYRMKGEEWYDRDLWRYYQMSYKGHIADSLEDFVLDETQDARKPMGRSPAQRGGYLR